jgi:hypothetical protein
MGSQRPLPTQPAHAFESRHDPRASLERLNSDRREAKAQLREVLERLAERHGISQKEINYAIDGYADDMLSDLVYSVERDLEHEREGTDRLDD